MTAQTETSKVGKRRNRKSWLFEGMPKSKEGKKEITQREESRGRPELGQVVQSLMGGNTPTRSRMLLA
jgi:hypothetical protein